MYATILIELALTGTWWPDWTAIAEKLMPVYAGVAWWLAYIR